MIAVADTSPICYLLLIGEIELLPTLFGEVVIPNAVAEELNHPLAPAVLREWIELPPAWLYIAHLVQELSLPQVAALDRGERDAILLARERKASLVVLDDKAGRLAARQLGLRITGTLGVLEAAAHRDLVDLRSAVVRLRETNFRASPSLLSQILRRNP